MNDLNTSTVETFITGLVTDAGGVAAAIIAATIGLSLGIFLAFKTLRWLKMELNTAPPGVNAFLTKKRYGRNPDGTRYDTWS